MERSDKLYREYIKILEEELVCAMGCTEPISVAYAAALARRTLGSLPESITVSVSGNILKNVKSVIVPHTGGMRGIEAAAAAGTVAGDPDAELEVLSSVDEEGVARMREYLKLGRIEVRHDPSPIVFKIDVVARAGGNEAEVMITDDHTNVVLIRLNDRICLDRRDVRHTEADAADRSLLTEEKIIEFADCLDPEDVRKVFGRQIECNMRIAEEGMKNSYGANIGKVLVSAYGKDVKIMARAMAAAASDARMNGCELPVVINSGSGNQGITSSVPVIVYAREYGKSEEELFRALAVSNLTTVHLKSGIGTLSAYCGAVSAGVGAGAGICYLLGGGFTEVAHTVVNAVAIVSGIICDGAKASCAAKIASAVDAGILGMQMYRDGNEFHGGDGIVKKGVENTIASVGRLAKDGMSGTDREIIELMLGDVC